MGLFDDIFGNSNKKTIRIDIVGPAPIPTQKERYEYGKEWERERAEEEAEDDPYRVEKSIKRHQKKSQKRQ